MQGVQDTKIHLQHAIVYTKKFTEVLQAASGYLRPVHLANNTKVLSPSMSRLVLNTLAASAVLLSAEEESLLLVPSVLLYWRAVNCLQSLTHCESTSMRKRVLSLTHKNERAVCFTLTVLHYLATLQAEKSFNAGSTKKLSITWENQPLRMLDLQKFYSNYEILDGHRRLMQSSSNFRDRQMQTEQLLLQNMASSQ